MGKKQRNGITHAVLKRIAVVTQISDRDAQKAIGNQLPTFCFIVNLQLLFYARNLVMLDVALAMYPLCPDAQLSRMLQSACDHNGCRGVRPTGENSSGNRASTR